MFLLELSKLLSILLRQFRCFKYISDSADENANDDWAKTVADGEEHYIKIFQQIVGGF